MQTIVTHGDVKILQYFNISEKVPYHSKFTGYHTGVDIECKEVYSAFPGTVILVNRPDTKTYTVIVQYNSNHAFAYCNLKAPAVEVGAQVDTDDLIGTCNKYVHVEYLNKSQTNRFRVMLVNQMFYKQDPLDILLNGYDSLINYSSDVAVSQSFLRHVKADEVEEGSAEDMEDDYGS